MFRRGEATVVVDDAHNADAMRALIEALDAFRRRAGMQCARWARRAAAKIGKPRLPCWRRALTN